jgi:hypothetical protein
MSMHTAQYAWRDVCDPDAIVFSLTGLDLYLWLLRQGMMAALGAATSLMAAS